MQGAASAIWLRYLKVTISSGSHGLLLSFDGSSTFQEAA
jgi:hypothetical protein